MSEKSLERLNEDGIKHVIDGLNQIADVVATQLADELKRPPTSSEIKLEMFNRWPNLSTDAIVAMFVDAACTNACSKQTLQQLRLCMQRRPSPS